MNQKELTKGFMTAALLLPERLARAVFSLPEADQLACEEIRLRLSRPMTAHIAGRSHLFSQKDGPVIGALLVRPTRPPPASIASPSGCRRVRPPPASPSGIGSPARRTT